MKVTFEHKYKALAAFLEELPLDEELTGEQLGDAIRLLDDISEISDYSDDTKMIVLITEIIGDHIY